MAEIAKSGKPSLSTTTPGPEHFISGHLAGENIAAGDACRIGSDKLIYRSSGAATGANAKVRGYAAKDASAGEAVTLLHGVTYRYGAGLTPGADVYLSGTVAGGLADAASTGGTGPIGYVRDDTRIFLRASAY